MLLVEVISIPAIAFTRNKRIAVVGRMKIGAFQQDGIPEAVPQPQVHTHRRKYIRQHLLTTGIDFYFLHITL